MTSPFRSRFGPYCARSGVTNKYEFTESANSRQDPYIIIEEKNVIKIIQYMVYLHHNNSTKKNSKYILFPHISNLTQNKQKLSNNKTQQLFITHTKVTHHSLNLEKTKTSKTNYNYNNLRTQESLHTKQNHNTIKIRYRKY